MSCFTSIAFYTIIVIIMCHSLCQQIGASLSPSIPVLSQSIYVVTSYLRTYVRPSIRSSSDSDEIWCVGRGLWVMHDGMPCGPIQGQGQGHMALKLEILPSSKSLSSSIFNGSWFFNQRTISKFERAGFLTSVLVFVWRDFELGRTWLAGGVDRQSSAGLFCK